MKTPHRNIILTSIALCIVSGALIIFSKRLVKPIQAYYNYPSFFDDFRSWYSSSTGKTDTLGQVVRAMNTSKTTFNDTPEAGEQFVDINGDGLLDFLYFGRGNLRGETSFGTKSSVFINKGNFTFDPVYKCVQYQTVYYGDCAQ